MHLLSRAPSPRTSAAMPELFDMGVRALRRDRAARIGPELFLHERAFEDCLDRLALVQGRFERALLVGCPDPGWPERLQSFAAETDVRDPGRSFATHAGGDLLIEDAWLPPEAAYDLVLAIGTLDTVNELPLALRLINRAMRGDGLLLGALSGGDTLPQLRNAMRAADIVTGAAAPHVHPRIEASALAPLLASAGFVHPVVDVDRVPVSYRSLDRLIADLRAMAATNVLTARPRLLGRLGREAASRAFRTAGDGDRTVETFQILHFAAWTKSELKSR
jgi:NADH dehydrogenase [ubiquinone] 1 alpha subcomplex assembly factor 5